MVAVADHQNINVVPLAELMNALDHVVRLFRFAVYRYVPSLADLLRCAVGSLIGDFQQARVAHLPVSFPGVSRISGMLKGEAAGRIHHTRLHGMQQVHLAPALPHQVRGKIYHHSTIFRKICSDQYPEHTLF